MHIFRIKLFKIWSDFPVWQTKYEIVHIDLSRCRKLYELNLKLKLKVPKLMYLLLVTSRWWYFQIFLSTSSHTSSNVDFILIQMCLRRKSSHFFPDLRPNSHPLLWELHTCSSHCPQQPSGLSAFLSWKEQSSSWIGSGSTACWGLFDVVMSGWLPLQDLQTWRPLARPKGIVLTVL